MFEKVNPAHPDKIADRIAGAIVDFAYTQDENPKIAAEVLIGHGECKIIAETSVELPEAEVTSIVKRIAGSGVQTNLTVCPQDKHLADNQAEGLRCGDNGIFRGCPVTREQRHLTDIARFIYGMYGSDGKYILDGEKLIICQSNARTEDLHEVYPRAVINPLGDWTGGTDVDSGATNRKLGSDMGDAVTGGGLHGKDLSKADVSVNIYLHLLAQQTGRVEEASCAIGDTWVADNSYSRIVELARNYVKSIGGFEKLAEWGLIR